MIYAPWPTKKTTLAHYWAMAHRLKTSGLDPALNDSCHIITGCLKSTNTNCLYLLAGIAPPDIRREVASRRERQKARHDSSHMLYRSEAANQRLKSRKSFLHTVHPLNMPSEEMRFELWKNRLKECPLKLAFSLEPAGVLCPWSPSSLEDWRCLNRLRTKTVKTQSTLAKWGFYNGPTLCKCGTADVTAAHLLGCPLLSQKCSRDDLSAFNNIAEKTVKFRKDYI